MNKQLEQPDLNIGLVGHIDHGKTTLLWRLTGIWADKHSEELKRGITIKLGYANAVIRQCKKCSEFTIQKVCNCGGETLVVKNVSFVDSPGHEMLMATMLGGAAVIDAALLIIAANEPFPQPQTKEHLLALEAKGINQIIIVQNKLDLVSKEQAQKQYSEIKDFIKNTPVKDAVIVPICAQQGINISTLLKAITELKAIVRDTKSKPVFLIARSFDINKPGTTIQELAGGIIGGSLKKGKLKVGDFLEIKPGITRKKHEQIEYQTVKTEVLGLMAGAAELKEVGPSGSIAIQTSFDPLITKADALAGCVAGLEGSLPEITYKIKLKVNLFKKIVGVKTQETVKIEPIKTNENLLLSANTATTLGLVIMSNNNFTEINLKIPIVPFKSERIGVARNYKGHWRLIGWGEII